MSEKRAAALALQGAPGMAKLGACGECGGFVTGGACPNCGAAPGAARSRALRALLECSGAIGGGALAFTLMACYGMAPCDGGGDECVQPNPIFVDAGGRDANVADAQVNDDARSDGAADGSDGGDAGSDGAVEGATGDAARDGATDGAADAADGGG